MTTLSWLRKGQVIYHWSEDIHDLAENARPKWKYGIIVGFLEPSDRIYFAMISSPDNLGNPKVKREYHPYLIQITPSDCPHLTEPLSFIECHRLSVKPGSILMIEFERLPGTESCGRIPEVLFASVIKNLMVYGSSDGNFSNSETKAISEEIVMPNYSHMYNGDI